MLFCDTLSYGRHKSPHHQGRLWALDSQISLVSLPHTAGMTQDDVTLCQLYYCLVRMLHKQTQRKLKDICYSQYLSPAGNSWANK